MTELCLSLHLYSQSPDIIAVTETWLSDNI